MFFNTIIFQNLDGFICNKLFKIYLQDLQPEGSIESEITSTDQCKDLFPNCNQLSSLCGIQTLQTVCQRTCNKCPENLQETSEDDVLLSNLFRPFIRHFFVLCNYAPFEKIIFL